MALSKKLLIAILLIAAILRFQGIFWGIPIFDPLVQGYHPDEPKIIKAAYKFPYHIITNKDLRYPTFYAYSLGTLSIPVKLAFIIKERSFNVPSLYAFMTVFGRYMSIVLGLGSIFLTFVLGKRLYGETVGLLSALFLSLSLYHVQNSAWMTLDVPDCFFILLTLYFAFKMYEQSTRRSYLITGVSLGILVGTKYDGAIVLLSILVLHYYRTLKNEEKKLPAFIKSSLSKDLRVLLLWSLAIFLLTTPDIILKPWVFIDALYAQHNLYIGREYESIFGFSIFPQIVKNFIIAADPILGILMILGLAYPFRKRWDKEIPLLAVVVPFLLYHGALQSRHLIAVLPLTSILAAQAVFSIYKKRRFLSLKPVWVSLLSLWITFAISYNEAGMLLRMNDTRTIAAHYIEENFPQGATIGATSIGNYRRDDWMLPKFDTRKYKIVDALEKPKFIILTSYDYIEMEEVLSLSKVQNEKWYRKNATNWHPTHSPSNLHNYKWDPKHASEWHRSDPPSEEVFRFYDDLLNEKGNKYNYRLIKKFEKNIFVPIEFPSPGIRIYERVED